MTAPAPLPPARRAHNTTAVLGPTNTGKTHLAIERMLAHDSGMIGLPLRLLAREVYNKVVERIGPDAVALITGEEKIKPAEARYYVCTVEAMPQDCEVAFLAIDEVQLASDFDRGHIFTDRILNLRGREETLLLGAATARPLIEALAPGINTVARPRMSNLSYVGDAKITRQPRRSAIVAFSASEVYAIAELIRRQRGGTAVVLGALSPRTRNAQVALYQSGDVDFLVATDAIGMGLNLDIDHVAFAAHRKFDGHQYRNLNPAELAQIAGRAGRHTRDGTFGVTGRVAPFEAELVEQLESHVFDPIKMLQWRNEQLDFATLQALKQSLAAPPREPGLTRAPTATDETVLEHLFRDEAVRELASSAERVALLWQVCQVPDYRKIAPANHAELVATLYRNLIHHGHISDDWFARQIAYADRTDGDIDTLSNRIAHVRTWTFVANRRHWLADPEHWQEKTRDIEDRLSDALHERLTQRFVDRRTSVLMRRLRENADLDVVIDTAGDVRVEDHFVGRLHGFHFEPDVHAGGTEGKALRAAALKALAGEFSARAGQLAAAEDKDFGLSDEGKIVWRGHPVAVLEASPEPLRPLLKVIADEQLQAADRERIEARLKAWLDRHLGNTIGPLLELARGEDLDGLAKGLAFRLAEAYGSVNRRAVANMVKSLEQTARAGLRQRGVRFGAHAIFVPALLKPAAANVIRLLWALQNGGLASAVLDKLPMLSAQGLMSVPIDPQVPAGYYEAIGYHIRGARAVRVDMTERLADVIRPLLQWKPAKVGDVESAGQGDGDGNGDGDGERAGKTDETVPEPAQPPEGALGDGRFEVTPQMMSLVGCSGEDFASILKALGFVSEPLAKPVRPHSPAEQTASENETAIQADVAATDATSGLKTELEATAQGAGQEPVPAAAETTTDTTAEAPASPALAWRVKRAGRSARPRRDKQRGRPPGERRDTQHGAPGKGEARHKPKPARKAGKANGKPSRDEDRQQRRPPRRERPVDPNSPFAALAGLKEKLKDRTPGTKA